MLAGLLALLNGTFGGGILALLTSGMNFFQKKQDMDHEYRMTELQLKIDSARSKQQIDLANVEGALKSQAKELDAYIAAVEGQSKLSGVKWVDGLSKSVRPIITYWWMILFTVVEGCMISMAIQHYSGLDALIEAIWTQNSWTIFGTILGFWFVDRRLSKVIK